MQLSRKRVTKVQSPKMQMGVKQIKHTVMKRKNEEMEYDGDYAYIILKDEKQIYLSESFDSQMDALRRGREDAQERNINGEGVEYEIVLIC